MEPSRRSDSGRDGQLGDELADLRHHVTPVHLGWALGGGATAEGGVRTLVNHPNLTAVPALVLTGGVPAARTLYSDNKG